MRFATAMALLTLCLLTVAAAREAEVRPVDSKTVIPAGAEEGPRGRNTLFFDDMEGGTNGWTSIDETGHAPHFHVDTYMAYSGSSWWCGSFDFDTDGGYGNSWDDRLDLPPVECSGYSYPVLEFARRWDCEEGYDYVYVQAESSGAFVNLSHGWDGRQSWGWSGYYIGSKDEPFVGRFRFVSDISHSDEDGLYMSAGGAFACDEIRVSDYTTYTTLFFDDVDSGGLCTPSAGPPSGDYWHIIERKCPAFSDPSSWWCGDDGDTAHIPARLLNSLFSPVVNIRGVAACTLYMKLHAEVPSNQGSSWRVSASTDSGNTWHDLAWFHGDMGACDGWWGDEALSLDEFLPGDYFQMRLTMITGVDGCGPGTAGGAGVMLDDVMLTGILPEYACCRDETCSMKTQVECDNIGGVWHPGATTCSPNPCIPNQTYLVRPDGAGDYPTIQAAVSAATHGDTISLANGVFSGEGNRDIDLLGKQLWIRSESGEAALCVINATGGAGFILGSGETRDAVIADVGISGADDTGLRFSGGSSPTVTGCVIYDCSGSQGGAVACDSSSPLFESCTFAGNSSAAGCLVASSDPAPELVACTFCDNTDESGAGACLVWADGAAPSIDNCIIAYTEGGAGSSGGAPTFSCTDICGNDLGDWTGDIASQLGVDGNISASPLFCGREGRDFALQSISPCSPDSSGSCGLIGAWPVGCSPLERACCVESDCSIVTSAECAALGGEWLAGVSSCDSLTCEERACCHDDTCATQREWDCISTDGSWRWDAVSCDPDPCAVAACCHASGCDVLTELDCVVLGGEWLEGVSSCDPSPCETAVCCLDDTCEVLLESQCQQVGGVWFPGMPSCAGNPCVLTVSPDGTGEYQTIQAAVDAAVDGQIVELEDGTYTGEGNRNVLCQQKSITIRSQSGNAEDCVVDCEGVCRGFVLIDEDGGGSVLQDITVTHGLALGDGYYGGGGVYADQCSPTIRGCRFIENDAPDEGGGGLSLDASSIGSGTVDDCVFVGNSAWQGGGLCVNSTGTHVVGSTFIGNSASDRAGALELNARQSTVENCTFFDNSSENHAGAASFHHTECLISNCTFCENSAPQGSGVRISGNGTCTPTFECCIIAFGTGGSGADAVICDPFSTANLQCCNLYGNEGGDWVGCVAGQYGQDGNICADPLFCDPEVGDLALREGSPCGPDESPSCGLIGALQVECVTGAFEGDPLLGLAPLEVSFTDLTPGMPDSWEWDFEADGVVDETEQDPTHIYTQPGTYTVKLSAGIGDMRALSTRADYVRAIESDALAIPTTEIVSSDPSPVPIRFVGQDSLGAISLYFDYDDTKLSYAGLETYVPGEMFSGGVVGDRISVQWFDETGGSDPIVPGVDPDTLFAVLFTNEVSADSTMVSFYEPLCVLGDAIGNTLEDVMWIDDHPYGTVYINIGAVVSGDVEYYWESKPVPDAELSMGPPNPDVLSDESGHYEFERYSYGSYDLTVDKTDDLGGINSLDAIKVIRHSTGVEPFGNAYKEQAANVNGDSNVNALDAIKIVRAAVGIEPLVSGDWAFDPESYSFDPLTSDQTADFTAIRMGDVNGDWSAGGRGERGGSRDSISVYFPVEEVVIADDPAQFPMLVTGFDAVGAVSLRVTFDNQLLEYAGITSRVPGVSFTSNLVGNEIRIEWFDATGGASPITVGSDTLLTVGVKLLGAEQDSCHFSFSGSCALGDATGDPIAGETYIDGVAVLSGGETSVDGAETPAFGAPQNYPNPFNPSTEISFTLTERGAISLRVYDLRGRLVKTLVDSREISAGPHRMTWDGRDDQGRSVASGVYFWELEGDEGSVRRRMVLVK